MHYVAALDDEAFNYSVKFCGLVALGEAGLWVTRLAGAELAEVFGGSGVGCAEEVDLDAA